MEHKQTTPAISKLLEDGGLLELLYDQAAGSTAFAVGRPGETPVVLADYQLPTGERLTPYSPNNNLIASGCVLLPSEIGDFGDLRDLVGRVAEFIHRYVDLSPEFEELAAYYVLLTWVYDRFNDLPYLRLSGTYGSGKTRALLVLGALCYKPFFGSGASTVSPIFHIQDTFQGTLVLDEADFRASDATAELTKVLNNGTTRGLPVLRTMTNRNRELNPTAFRVFGPKIIAMREKFSDLALESRFFTEETGGRPLRADIPIHLPDSFASESCALRNDLLAWRLARHHTIRPELSRLPEGISPRTEQMALSLLSIIEDEDARRRVCRWLLDIEGKAYERQAAEPEAVMRRVIAEAFSEASGAVPIAEVTRRFNEAMDDRFELSMSIKSVGWFVRTRLRISTMKSGGVYVIPATERARFAPLSTPSPDMGIREDA